MSLNPWFVLLVGILVGWMFNWLLELFFFRRGRPENQQRLASTEAQLQARDAELQQMQVRIATLEAASAAGSGAVTNVVTEKLQRPKPGCSATNGRGRLRYRNRRTRRGGPRRRGPGQGHQRRTGSCRTRG